jgi:glycosyltransferase involved in cell wall biosynthesis
LSEPRSRNVLLIAYHYPPCAMSSGVQRSLSFSVHLRQHGWQPAVLSVHPSSYERTNPQQLQKIPADLPVTRTVALDAARHLAIGGRYWSRLALPDRWRAWWLTAVPAGLRLIRQHRIDVIWSTYPIATAHLIAATLARLSGRPWVADFRDPMVERVPETGELFPQDPALREARLKVEAVAVNRATRLVFCTGSARRIVAERYPALTDDRLAVISNGFDEQAFRDAEAAPRPARGTSRRVLLHSGTIYPGPDRDPTALFKGIRQLADANVLTPENFELRLRHPSNEDYFRKLAVDTGVADLVTILPPLSYREALSEMLCADGLLLLQGYPSNPAIPAKLYEYLRARRPLVALVDSGGETAAALRELRIDTVAQLTEPAPIAQLLSRWMSAGAQLESALPARETIAAYSREGLTERLARVLDQAAASGRARSPP